MDRKLLKNLCVVNLCIMITLLCMSVFNVACTPQEAISLVPTSAVETVAEYGTYFGAKSNNLPDDKAKILEESLRVAIQLIDKNTVSDFVDINEILAKIPEVGQKYVAQAISIVNSKFSAGKDKIPTKYIPYLRAVFSGGFKGIEKYRSSIGVVEVSSNFEVDLSARYNKALDELKQ